MLMYWEVKMCLPELLETVQQTVSVDSCDTPARLQQNLPVMGSTEYVFLASSGLKTTLLVSENIMVRLSIPAIVFTVKVN